jgi:NADPH-dependent ferric siderophore reductase
MTLTAHRSLPFVLAEVQVVAVERLSPAFVRVWLGGPEVADIGVDGPFLDQRFKLILPGPSGPPRLEADHPDGWYAAWCALPENERGHMRTYTVRALEDVGGRVSLVVDVVVHEDAPERLGPGCRWALGARIGDVVTVVAPRRGAPFGGIEYQPGRAGRVLLVGDETAAPAIASILESAPVGTSGCAYVEVPSSADVLEVRTPPGLRLVWLPRNGAAHGERALAAVRGLFGLPNLGAEATHLRTGSTGAPGAAEDVWETPGYSTSGEAVVEGEPDQGLYAWVAGESALVRAARRVLVNEVGMPRRQVAFMGYWRHGVAMA